MVFAGCRPRPGDLLEVTSILSDKGLSSTGGSSEQILVREPLQKGIGCRRFRIVSGGDQRLSDHG